MITAPVISPEPDLKDDCVKLESFPRFPKLPAEFRIAIYKYAQASTPPRHVVFDAPPGCEVYETTHRISRQVPALLHVNQEARLQFLSTTYVPVQYGFHEKKVIFDKHRDTLVLRGGLHPPSFPPTSLSFYHAVLFREVQNIAYIHDWWMEDFDILCFAGSLLLNSFLNFRRVTFITRELSENGNYQEILTKFLAEKPTKNIAIPSIFHTCADEWKSTIGWPSQCTCTWESWYENMLDSHAYTEKPDTILRRQWLSLKYGYKKDC